MASRENQEIVTITLDTLQKTHKSTKQLPRDQTRPLQQRVTHNKSSTNNRLHAAKG